MRPYFVVLVTFVLLGRTFSTEVLDTRELYRKMLETQRVQRVVWSPDRPFPQEVVEAGLPIILENSAVVTWPAFKLWTPQYMKDLIKQFSIVSEGTSPEFLFYHAPSPLAKPVEGYTWTPPYARTANMSSENFWAFAELMESPRPQSEHYLYLAEKVASGSPIELDIGDRKLILARSDATANSWLWMGARGVTATAHYDREENSYAQIYGHKRFVLLPPSTFEDLMMYPRIHPSSRQAQRNSTALFAHLELPQGPPSHSWVSDDAEAPRVQLREGSLPLLTPVERRLLESALVADIRPGDLLYFPPYWFHHVQSLTTSMSVNSWCKGGSDTVFYEELTLASNFSVPLEWDSFALALATHVYVEALTQHALAFDSPAAAAAFISSTVVTQRYLPLFNVAKVHNVAKAQDWTFCSRGRRTRQPEGGTTNEPPVMAGDGKEEEEEEEELEELEELTIVSDMRPFLLSGPLKAPLESTLALLRDPPSKDAAVLRLIVADLVENMIFWKLGVDLTAPFLFACWG